MKRPQGAAIRLNRARSSMIVNRFADTGIIGKRQLCVNRVTDQHQIENRLLLIPRMIDSCQKRKDV